ncbi:hypothetical protein BDR22DRAFT_965503 [Usnea florida]
MYTLCAIIFTFFSRLLLAIPTTALDRSLINLTDSAFLSSPTSLKLTFDLHGSQIPSPAVNAAFNGAITRIHPFLQIQPNSRIPGNDFQFRPVGGSVQIGVTGAPRHQVTWQQLDSVLRQAASFMNGDLGTGRRHMQELSFEIIQDRTTIGDGLVSYRPVRGLQPGQLMPADLTNLNGTGLLLSATDPSLYKPTVNGILYPIPNTSFTLNFRFFGTTIPISNVSAAFEGAHSQILGSLAREPDSPIPLNGFDYVGNGVRISISDTLGYSRFSAASNTPIVVTSKYLGKSIRRYELDGACWAALCQISPSYREQGTDVDPPHWIVSPQESVDRKRMNPFGRSKPIYEKGLDVLRRAREDIVHYNPKKFGSDTFFCCVQLDFCEMPGGGDGHIGGQGLVAVFHGLGSNEERYDFYLREAAE